MRLVAHHFGAVYEAKQRGLSAELAVYEREDSPVLDALIFADMTTGPAGQSLDFDTRIDEILVCYEPGTEVHNAIRKARPYLGAAVARTRSRLVSAPDHLVSGNARACAVPRWLGTADVRSGPSPHRTHPRGSSSG
ncbi:hypothetical protein ACFVY4_30965 [Streptomyces sp. NPDC058299]|uniref:hypothetical protein n=1 Tax=Streptomyces sp. NPDC058299 TaxID=3346435 RepID=UPI0036DFD95D